MTEAVNTADIDGIIRLNIDVSRPSFVNLSPNPTLIINNIIDIITMNFEKLNLSFITILPFFKIIDY